MSDSSPIFNRHYLMTIMTNYKHLESVCKKQSDLSAEVIDNFLMYYVAAKEGLDVTFDRKLSRYKHVSKLFHQGSINLFKSQYITHKIFKRGGSIRRYLNHRAIKELEEEQIAFLRFQAQHPWMYTFCEIIDNPYGDFYEMMDVFSGETFLLFSPGTSDILEEQGVRLWLHLVSYNGACWQSFGPIGSFISFDPDDIFFYASEIDQEIVGDEDLLAHIEKNPLPYMMLMSDSMIPTVMHNEHELVHHLSEYNDINIDANAFKADFVLEASAGIVRMELPSMVKFPHFSTAYYDPKNQVLMLSAMTQLGFGALVNALKTRGLEINEYADIRVHPSMLLSVERILRKQVVLNPYEELFDLETPVEEKEQLDRINHFMQMALKKINARQDPDIEALAKEAGVDIDTARDIFRAATEKFDSIGNERPEN